MRRRRAGTEAMDAEDTEMEGGVRGARQGVKGGMRANYTPRYRGFSDGSRPWSSTSTWST
jgi:hypothetical protein